VSDDGRHMVIRPLAYVKEDDLEAYAQWRAFPIIPCTLCGSQENLKRKQAKLMLQEWERRHPGRVDTIFAALSRVVPSHLMDRELFDFATLTADGQPSDDGDIAFDVDPVLEAHAPANTAVPGEQVLTLQRTIAADPT